MDFNLQPSVGERATLQRQWMDENEEKTPLQSALHMRCGPQGEKHVVTEIKQVGQEQREPDIVDAHSG